ncbi:LOW QUALITY PROTEIN: uncharacterized protein LOC128393612 [Panonychus citri]|uniref:LOW QUALITY PROTEIN: uncharacterized protein LOC128393612 n=1 Tax=Panonychus citri TaxID=50023 RepID=UPI002307402A|nr:LOW QUALITY PROTEIN: uncharacterized protein LOC128393612 [Panonychus citri]
MDSLDLSNLSAEEYEKIMTVMKRDQMLRKQEEQRILPLKVEINRLRKKGAIRPGINSSAVCGRCLTELGYILNRGAFCPICRKKVCKSCRFFADKENPIDGHQWVCIVCSKQMQFKAVSGEWMKELTRSASEKIRSPSTSVFATATENLGRSLKYSFRSGFLKQNNNQQNEGGLSINSKLGSNSESQLNSPSLSNQQLNSSDHFVGVGGGGGRVGGSVICLDQTSNLAGDNISSNYRRFYRSRGQLPPKLPPTVNTTSCVGDSVSKSPPSDGSGSQETSPKPPLSPVVKAYQAAVDLVATDTSRTMLNTAPGERKMVYRKVSNRLLDSSSSEEEEEDDLRPSSHSRASSESTPSPRTPNSCKILSGISANQATAFKFPPLSPVPSRSTLRTEKPLERIPMEHQSSDEFSATPLSSFRSRSTSSETPDETSTSGGGGSSSGGGSSGSKVLTPENGSRNRRISPLRKQRAIAEELQADLPGKLALSCQINTSGIDSSLVGFTGNDYSTIINPSPNVVPSMGNNNNAENLIRRDHSGGIDSGIECGGGGGNHGNNRSRKGSSWTSWYHKDKPATSEMPTEISSPSSIGSSKKSSKVSTVSGTPLATYSRFNQILANNNSHCNSTTNTVGASSRSPVLTSSQPSVYNIERSLVNSGEAEDDSESEATVENTTGVVFRKVTIKKRLSRTQSDRGSPSPTGSSTPPPPSPLTGTSVTPRSPLISPRSNTNSPDLQQNRQQHQPRYTQSPCCSPVPLMESSTISPTINSPLNQNKSNSINRSLTDDPCRRANGAIGTYVKSHSAVNPKDNRNQSDSSQFNHRIKKLVNNQFVNCKHNQPTRKQSNQHNNNNNQYNRKDVDDESNNLTINGPRRYTKSDRRSSGMNGLRPNHQSNRSQANDKYFQYRLSSLPTTTVGATTSTSPRDGYVYHPSSYRSSSYGDHQGSNYHPYHPQSMNHLHHRLKGLSLDSHAFVRRNIARLGSYGSPAKRRIVKLTKKLRRGLLFIASRLKGRHRKGKSTLSGYESTDYDQVTLERYNCSWLARSVSLPNHSDPNRTLAQISQNDSWKYGSIDQRLWQLECEDEYNEDEIDDDYSESNYKHVIKSRKSSIGRGKNELSDEEYEIGLNDEVISGEGKYQLVFMDRNTLGTIESSSEQSDTDGKQNNRRSIKGRQQSINRPRMLRVRSHLEIADGTAYIEDSDWEMCSDPGELPISSSSLSEAIGSHSVTSLFKIYQHDSYTNCYDQQTIGYTNEDAINVTKTINGQRSYCTTLSDPGISLGHDALLTVVDCPEESIVYSKDDNNQWSDDDSDSISSSLLSRSTSPSTPSTLSTTRQTISSGDSGHHQQTSSSSSSSSSSTSHNYTCIAVNGKQHGYTKSIDCDVNFGNHVNHHQSTNWERNRRLDDQVTNWNLGLTLMTNMNDDHAMDASDGQKNEDVNGDTIDRNNGREIQSTHKDQSSPPPSRPPRANRRRQLTKSSITSTPTNTTTISSSSINNSNNNYFKHSNQLVNQNSSSVLFDSVRLSSIKPSITDFHETLYNLIVDKHQSFWDITNESVVIKNFTSLTIGNQDNQLTNYQKDWLKIGISSLSQILNHINIHDDYDEDKYDSWVNCDNPNLRINLNERSFQLTGFLESSTNQSDNWDSLSSNNERTVNLTAWYKPESRCYPFYGHFSTLPFCLVNIDDPNSVNYHQSNHGDKQSDQQYHHHQIYHLIKSTQWLDQHDLSKHWSYFNFPLSLTIISPYCYYNHQSINSKLFSRFVNNKIIRQIDSLEKVSTVDDYLVRPVNQVECCLIFDLIKFNWCKTVWTQLTEIVSETYLMLMIKHLSSSTNKYHHLTFSPIQSSSSSLLFLDKINLISVNREINQDLQLIVDNNDEVNINCQQSGTETGLNDLRQIQLTSTVETTSPLPPPSTLSPPPLISPSSSSSSSSSLNCLPPFNSSKLKKSSQSQSETKSTLKDFIENSEAVVSIDHDDDDENEDDDDDCGGSGYREIIISRGSSYSSCKEAVRPDDDKREDDERAETAPIRNQSEEESYLRSELEKSCNDDQFARNQFIVTSSSSSQSSSTLASELIKSTTTTSLIKSTSEKTVSPLTQEAITITGEGEQLNSDCNYYINGLKGEIDPSIIDKNHVSCGSLVRSPFNINCDNQSKQINCQPNSSNNNNNHQQHQLFLLTCLPIQPTVNVYNQLNVNKTNNNSYVNGKYANHNTSNNLNASKLISPSFDCITLNEVNYDSLDSRLATSKHQHNQQQLQQFNQINLTDWTTTSKTTTKISETVNGNNLTHINNTRADKLINFSSLLLQLSSPVTTILSSSPRGLSLTHQHHLPNHPLILSLYFQHLHNSTTIVDNQIKQIVIPGFLYNNIINYYHDNNGELVKPYESDYLIDILTPTAKLLQLNSVSNSSRVDTIDDENDDCLLINNQDNPPSFVKTSNQINSENSQYSTPSTQPINLQSSTLQLINKLSVIKSNIGLPSTSTQSVSTNQQSTTTTTTTTIVDQSTLLTNCNYDYDDYLTGENSNHLNHNNYMKKDIVVDKETTMSLYKTSNGHKKSTSSSPSSTSTGLLNNLTHHLPSDDEEDEDEEEYIVDDDEMGSTSSDESFPPPVLPGHSLGGIYGGFGGNDGVGGGGGGSGSTSGMINNNYGNPLAYSLHTIIEESCEESESESLLSRISDNTDNENVNHENNNNNGKSQNNMNDVLIPPSSESSTNSLSTHHNHHLNYYDDDPGDPENYTAFQIGHNVITTNGNSSGHHHHSQGGKRLGSGHVSFSKDFQPTGDFSDEDDEEVDDEGSDNMSETSETLADFGDEDDLDPITLASSRLEKYFTSGLLGSGAYDYPDDVEFQDDDDDDPNDLYNQAKKINNKVEIKVNNKNVTNQPQQSSDNQDNISNGISMVTEESNVIKSTTSSSLSPTTITTASSSSSSSSPPPQSTATITVDTQLSKPPTVTTTTTIIHHNIKSKEEDNLIKEDDGDYFNTIKSVQHNDSFNCDHVKTEIKESESKLTTTTTTSTNKETNESQIVNKIVINDDEQQSKQQLANHLPSNNINNQPTIDSSLSNLQAKRKKEVTTIMSIINSDNCNNDDGDNTNHQKDNVNHHQSPVSSNVDSVVSRKTVQSVTRSIQVKPQAPQPPTNQVNSLINSEKIKSSSSSSSSNVAISTKSSNSRTELNPLFSSSTKSNQSDERINLISSVRKESNSSTSSSSTTTTTTISKPSVETTIRFGPSPQLVRSLLAAMNSGHQMSHVTKSNGNINFLNNDYLNANDNVNHVEKSNNSFSINNEMRKINNQSVKINIRHESANDKMYLQDNIDQLITSPKFGLASSSSSSSSLTKKSLTISTDNEQSKLTKWKHIVDDLCSTRESAVTLSLINNDYSSDNDIIYDANLINNQSFVGDQQDSVLFNNLNVNELETFHEIDGDVNHKKRIKLLSKCNFLLSPNDSRSKTKILLNSDSIPTTSTSTAAATTTTRSTSYDEDENDSDDTTTTAPTECKISHEMDEIFGEFVEPKINDYQMENKKMMMMINNNETIEKKREDDDKRERKVISKNHNNTTNSDIGGYSAENDSDFGTRSLMFTYSNTREPDGDQVKVDEDEDEDEDTVNERQLLLNRLRPFADDDYDEFTLINVSTNTIHELVENHDTNQEERRKKQQQDESNNYHNQRSSVETIKFDSIYNDNNNISKSNHDNLNQTITSKGHKTILKIDSQDSGDFHVNNVSLMDNNVSSSLIQSNEIISRQIVIPSTNQTFTIDDDYNGVNDNLNIIKQNNNNNNNQSNSDNEKPLKSSWETQDSLLTTKVPLKSLSESHGDDEISFIGENNESRKINSSSSSFQSSTIIINQNKSNSTENVNNIFDYQFDYCYHPTSSSSLKIIDENENDNCDDNFHHQQQQQQQSVMRKLSDGKTASMSEPFSSSSSSSSNKPLIRPNLMDSADYHDDDTVKQQSLTSSSCRHDTWKGQTLNSNKGKFSIEINSKTNSLPSNYHHHHNQQADHLNPQFHPHRYHHTFSRLKIPLGVMKKLSSLRDEKSSTRRLITNRRKLIGGSEPCPSNESTSAVPHISVSDYSESFSHRGSIGSSGGDDIFTSTEDDVDKAFAYHNRSQTSLSSFGARSESLSSVYSAAGGGRYGTVTISGEILFSLVYKQSESSLELYIKECRNLAPVDSKRNRSDPYVKLYLLPDRSKSGKRKTKVKKHTLNPIFDENLKFYLPVNQLDGRTLWISVWHSDIFGRNDFLGEVTLPLTKDILRNSGLRWYPLQERIDQIESNPVNYKGGIFIALKFVPTGANKGPGKPIGVPGKLLVMVKEAHNLMPTRSNGTSDPFVKCYLLPDKTKKLKTPVIKKTVNPRWNHTFEVSDITTNDLQTRCLELTIWDYDKLTSNDFLGGVRLSLGQGIYEGKPVDWLDSTEQETTLWKQLLDKTDLWVYGELPLRTSLQSRTSFGR